MGNAFHIAVVPGEGIGIEVIGVARLINLA